MKKLFLIIMVLTLLLVSACSFSPPGNGDESQESTHPSVFNGKETGKNTYQAVGVMIENSVASRPQSALGLADIVYENAVETYTITRFMAIFASEYPTKAGPVRSARIPFVRMAQEWGLPYAHFGSASTGQGDAKSLMESIEFPIRFDGNHGLNNEFFSRDEGRKSPHNAYFNVEAARGKIPELEYEKCFDFDETTNIDQQDISRFSLGYSADNQVGYEYDSENQNYLRSINNQPMMDAYMEDQIRVTNIILLHAPHTTAEKANYVLVDFLGEGKAEYFVNGKYEEGTWKKASHEDPTAYFDSEGHPIVLLPGNTWIQVVHPNVEMNKE